MTLTTTFFDSLIDDFGIWQHTDGTQPLLKEGYALDDATRGLLLTLELGRSEQSGVLFDYIKQSFRDNLWHGFATAQRQFIMAPASEDATGQVVWAMGSAIRQNFRVAEARIIFDQAKAQLQSPHYLRGPVYALLGATDADPEWAAQLAQDILNRFNKTSRSWPWPEEYLTYGNGIIPYALLRYGAKHAQAEAFDLGLQTLSFVDKACRLHHFLGPIGNQGWYGAANPHPPVFSQQPIDAAYMVWACQAAYVTSENPHWLTSAKEWMAWFDGDNITGQAVVDYKTGKCHDGIDGPSHISTNSGAESNVCYLLAKQLMDGSSLF